MGDAQYRCANRLAATGCSLWQFVTTLKAPDLRVLSVRRGLSRLVRPHFNPKVSQVRSLAGPLPKPLLRSFSLGQLPRGVRVLAAADWARTRSAPCCSTRSSASRIPAARRHVLYPARPSEAASETRRARLRPHRVDRRDRLSRVLTVVGDALALALQPFGRDQPWVPLLEPARHALRERVGLLEVARRAIGTST